MINREITKLVSLCIQQNREEGKPMNSSSAESSNDLVIVFDSQSDTVKSSDIYKTI